MAQLPGRKSLPSANPLRNFLYAFHDEALIEKAQRERPEGRVAYIPQENAPLRGLGQVDVERVRRIDSLRPMTKATLEHDATIVESHEKQAMAHYEQGRGYQPHFRADSACYDERVRWLRRSATRNLAEESASRSART